MPNLTELKTLTEQIHKIHTDYEGLFNTLVEEYLRISTQWKEQKFKVEPLIEDIRLYQQWSSFINSQFYSTYCALMNVVPSLKSDTPGDAFRLIESFFEPDGITISIYNRPDNTPFDLLGFITCLNHRLNARFARLYKDSELGNEDFPKIQFSYTGKSALVRSFYEKRPRDFHQLTANALVEAHLLLQDWWTRNNKPRRWDSVEAAEKMEFRTSLFCRLLEAHPTLSGLYSDVIFELYFSAFKDAQEGCTDIQSLVNAIRDALKKFTLASSYSDFDDFSVYTGTHEKVFQLIKENEDAEFAKIQIPFNAHIENVYKETNRYIKPEDREDVLKVIGKYSFTRINYSLLSKTDEEFEQAYNQAFSADGSFNIKTYQQSISTLLKDKLNLDQDMVYTGDNSSVLDCFNPQNPPDFHQSTANKLLEAHAKLRLSWGEYGLGIWNDELRKQFHQSEFCTIIDEHPTLKRSLPFERERLYLSIFEGKSYDRHNIPAFIKNLKDALKKSPHHYQSYADFFEYTGNDDAVSRAAQDADLAAAQINYNKFLKETQSTATMTYLTKEQKVEQFKKFHHEIFLSIDPDKLDILDPDTQDDLSMLDSFVANLGEGNTFNLLAFQTSLNSVLDKNIQLKMQYTGTNKSVLKALAVPAAEVAVKAEETEAATMPVFGEAEFEKAQPEKAQPEKAQPEKAQPERAQSEKAQSEKAQSEKAQSEKVQPEKAQPERAQSEKAQSEKAQSETDGATNPEKAGQEAAQAIEPAQFSHGNNALLQSILDSLIENIQGKAKTTRLTHSNSCNKIEKLTALKNKIGVHPPILANTLIQDEFIEQMKSVCSIKRNFYHFWAEPHSVKELQGLLDLHGIKHSRDCSSKQSGMYH